LHSTDFFLVRRIALSNIVVDRDFRLIPGAFMPAPYLPVKDRFAQEMAIQQETTCNHVTDFCTSATLRKEFRGG
jgi:hypothetical protein